MNVKEAKEAVKLTPMSGNTTENAGDLYLRAFSKGFLECHERYKPLVEALEYASQLNDTCIPKEAHTRFNCQSCILKIALNHYRKEILGEK